MDKSDNGKKIVPNISMNIEKKPLSNSEIRNQIEIVKECILKEAQQIIEAGMMLKLEDLVKLVLQKHIVSDDNFHTAIKELIKQKKFIRSDQAVAEIAQLLISENIIADKSKLCRFNLLDNTVRNHIFTFICQNPGSTFKDFQILEISNETISYHLSKLIQFQFIRFRIIMKTKAYFSLDYAVDEDYLAFFLRKENYKEIILAIKEKKEVKLIDLCILTNKHHSTIKYHLNNLVKYGLIKAVGFSQNKKYTLTKFSRLK